MIWRGLATIKERATDERGSVSGGLLGYSRVVVKNKKWREQDGCEGSLAGVGGAQWPTRLM